MAEHGTGHVFSLWNEGDERCPAPWTGSCASVSKSTSAIRLAFANGFGSLTAGVAVYARLWRVPAGESKGTGRPNRPHRQPDDAEARRYRRRSAATSVMVRPAAMPMASYLV